MKPVLILYGSQTGAAKSIAETLHTEATAKGYTATIAPLNDHSKIGFLTAPVVVMVVSTTGNGDPPNNAEEFWRYIRRRTQPKELCAGITFAMLGLGDTNYDKFCNAAKTIQKRMFDLSSSEFYPIGCADEATGLDAVVEPWVKGLWPALATACGAAGAAGGAATASAAASTSTSASPTKDAGAAGLTIAVNGGAEAPAAGAPASSAADGAGASAAPASPVRPASSPMSLLSALRAQHPLPAPAHGADATLASASAADGARPRSRAPSVASATSDATHHAAPHLGSHASAAAAAASTAALDAVHHALETIDGSDAAAGTTTAAGPTAAHHHASNADVIEAAAQAAAAAAGAAMAAATASGAHKQHDATAHAAPPAAAAPAPAVAAATVGLRISSTNHADATPLPSSGSAFSLPSTLLPQQPPQQQASAAACAQMLTPGVKSFFELFPKHRTTHDAAADADVAAGAAGAAPAGVTVIPAATAPAVQKTLPKLPPVVWSVAVLPPQPDAPCIGTTAPPTVPAGGLPATLGGGSVAFPTSLSTGSLSRATSTGITPGAASVAAGASPPVLPPALTAATPQSVGAGAVGALSTGSATSTPRASAFAQNGSSGGAASASSAVPAVALPAAQKAIGRCLETPVVARVVGARYQTSGGRASDRRVVFTELDVAGTPLANSWDPGDAIGVIVPNDAHMVAQLCRRLGVDGQARLAIASATAGSAAPSSACAADASPGGEQSFLPAWMRSELAAAAAHRVHTGDHADVSSTTSTPRVASASATTTPSNAATVPTPLPTLADVFTWCVDLTSTPKKTFLRLLADSCVAAPDAGITLEQAAIERDVLAFLAGRTGKDAFTALIEDQRLTLLDLLALFPSCSPPLAALLSALQPLSPRYYSLACSPLADPNLMSFAFTVVEYVCEPNGGLVAVTTESPVAAAAAATPAGSAPVGTPASFAVDAASALHARHHDGAALIRRRGIATAWLEGLCGPYLEGAQPAAYSAQTIARRAGGYGSALNLSAASSSSPFPTGASAGGAGAAGASHASAGAMLRSVSTMFPAPSPLDSPRNTGAGSAGSAVAAPSPLRVAAAGPAASAAAALPPLPPPRSSSLASSSSTSGASASHGSAGDVSAVAVLRQQFARHSLQAAATSTTAQPAVSTAAANTGSFEIGLEPFPSSPSAGAADTSITTPGGTASPLHAQPAPAAAGASPAVSGAAPFLPPCVRIFIRDAKEFALPASPEKPIIMIGPGTGVAPFVGFLQHRAAKVEKDTHAAVAVCRGYWRGGCRITSLREDAEFHTPLALGPAYLFFGNRKRTVDFLFEKELQDYAAKGVLTRMFTAFSREQEEAPPADAAGGAATTAGTGTGKVYVQHRMREAGALLADLILNKGAHIYVCGDGARMAKDVHAELVSVLHTHAASVSGGHGMTEAEATEALQGLGKKGRYVRDIWS